MKGAGTERAEELRRRQDRKGRRLAWCVAAAVAALGLAGIRLEDMPEGRNTARAPKVRWGGDGGEGGTGMRAVLDPTAYALAGKAGFTGAWWTEKPDAVLLEEGGAAEAAEKKEEGGTWSAVTGKVERRRPFTGGRRVVAAAGRSLAATERTAPGPSKPEMRFPEGWEPRMFSGVELDYPDWTARSWRARAEVEFDATGQPEHVFLTEPSGLTKVDARLALGLRRWRLLDGAAARRGEVEWVVPGRQGTPVRGE